MDGSSTPLSPEAPQNLASLWQRLAARLIDTFILLLILVLSSYFSSLLFYYRIFGVSWIFDFLALAYFLGADAFKGQSLGKRAMKIVVVDAQTYVECGFLQSVVRNVSLSMLSLLDAVFIFFGWRRRLGDMLASTLVLRS